MYFHLHEKILSSYNKLIFDNNKIINSHHTMVELENSLSNKINYIKLLKVLLTEFINYFFPSVLFIFAYCGLLSIFFIFIVKKFNIIFIGLIVSIIFFNYFISKYNCKISKCINTRETKSINNTLLIFLVRLFEFRIFI
jgi:hypothetical protein